MDNKRKLDDNLYSDPKYRGKHVIVADGKVYTTKNGDRVITILNKLRKENPNVVPTVSFNPDVPSLTL